MRHPILRGTKWRVLSVALFFMLAAWRGPLTQAQSQPGSLSQAAPQSADNYPDQIQSQLQAPDQSQYQNQSPEQLQGDDRLASAPADPVSPDSHVRIVRISYVDGEVRIDHGSGYESATMNVPVTEHNWLQTRSDGWAELQFEDGSMMRLAPDTTITLTELSRTSSGSTITTVDLDQGEASFKIARRDRGEFQVTVRNKTIILDQAASFRVTSVNSDPLEVVVWKGAVTVHDSESGGDVEVRKNETFALNPTDVAQYALDKGAEADSLDEWGRQRDQYLSTYARNNSLQSPYQYGTSDLSNYGEYFDDPGYGTLWQPTGVNLGWDPYGNGYWAYSPGFGYTWVSAYPWGWLPFRYGHWIYINHRGWCWAPGGWDRWHTGPRWVNAPPGFRPPVPPANDRIVISGAPGGRVVRPGTPGDRGGAGARSSGSPNGNVGGRTGGGRTFDRDGEGGPGAKGTRHVFTNDDVARVPRTDVPARQTPPVIDADSKPKVVEQPPAAGGRTRQRGDDGARVDREPPRNNVSQDTPSPAGRSRVSNSPERSAPPPPPPPQPARQYSPAPAQVQRSSPPPPAAAPAAPARQSAPQESHSRSDDSGSRSGRPK